MKIKRYKKVHKILKFYSHNFGFRKPYQVLIDGTLCFSALKHKINIQEQFPKYLDGEVKLLTTQCIVQETEKLGHMTFGAFVIVKQFPVHSCGHSKSPLCGSECILDMIKDNNPARYIIATQDKDLQKKCRKIKGVPLLYLHLATPTLEHPSNVSQEFASAKVSSQLQVREFEKQRLNAMKEPEEEEVRKKRKRKGGPNPLSCKKKKRKANPNPESVAPKNEKTKKRKRKRNRLVKKIKNELATSAT